MKQDPRLRFRELKELFLEAREHPSAEQEAFLDRRCPGDELLRREVLELLSHDATAEADAPIAADAPPSATEEEGAKRLAVGRGDQLGPYRIERRIGAGGMGEVFEAVDPRLDRRVAVKLLLPELTRHPAARSRFVREARMASSLDHPNLCPVFDIGEAEDGRTFLAMAYYEGRTLDEELLEGPIAIDRVVQLAHETASGLAAAHRQGVVHRDIKAGNLMLTSSGVKILDFGLAKLENDRDLTRSGAPLGTPTTMAPEQARGEPAGPATDVWGVGVVLYEALTGRAPFEGDSIPRVLYSIVHEEATPLAELRPETPSWLASVVDRCLRKAPEDRFADGAELLAALEAREEAPPASRPRPARPAGMPKRWALFGLALGAVALAMSWGIGWWPSDRGPAPVEVGPVEVESRSIAVLPFRSVGSSEDIDLMAGGLADRVSGQLSKHDGLAVIARASVLRLSGQDLPLIDIARRLGVQTMVTGRLEQLGGRVAVTAELVDGGSGRQLWSERFERPADDLLGVEQELSRRIAGGLFGTLTSEASVSPESVDPSGNPSGSVSPEAYRSLLVGLHHLHQARTELAAEPLRRAVELAPDYAPAWAALARNYVYSGFFGRRPAVETYSLARQAAERALDLDPGLADGHATLALFAFFAEGNAQRALDLAQQAVDLDPGSAFARYVYGTTAITTDQPDLAVRELRASVRVDPLSPAPRAQLGRALLRQRRWGEAEATSRENLELNPDFRLSWWVLAMAQWFQGQRQLAIEELTRIDEGYARVWLLADAGRTEELRALLDEIAVEAGSDGPRGPILIGRLVEGHLLLGDDSGALHWLRRMAELPPAGRHLISNLSDPLLDPLRSDPTFRELIAEFGAAASFGWPGVVAGEVVGTTGM